MTEACMISVCDRQCLKYNFYFVGNWLYLIVKNLSSPELVVMRGESCFKGCGFKSQPWTFVYVDFFENSNFCSERPKINY